MYTLAYILQNLLARLLYYYFIGAAQGVPPSSVAHCVSRLQSCLGQVCEDLAGN